jgi:hypothetical protein
MKKIALITTLATLTLEGANLRATQQAWPRTIAFLRQHTR